MALLRIRIPCQMFKPLSPDFQMNLKNNHSDWYLSSPFSFKCKKQKPPFFMKFSGNQIVHLLFLLTVGFGLDIWINQMNYYML